MQLLLFSLVLFSYFTSAHELMAREYQNQYVKATGSCGYSLYCTRRIDSGLIICVGNIYFYCRFYRQLFRGCFDVKRVPEIIAETIMLSAEVSPQIA